jgi:hypothetical protein
MIHALVMPKSGTDFAILLLFLAESEIDRNRVEESFSLRILGATRENRSKILDRCPVH